jgi:hypothetical protein
LDAALEHARMVVDVFRDRGNPDNLAEVDRSIRRMAAEIARLRA